MSLSQLFPSLSSDMKHFKVTGMSCAACSSRVEKAVSKLNGVRFCSVNLLSGSMSVDTDLSNSVIIDAVKRAGYGASSKNDEDEVKEGSGQFEKPQRGGILPRLIASLVLLIPLMYISMGYVMFSAPVPRILAEYPIATALIEMILSAGVLVINQSFFINGFKGVISRAPNMDTLVSMGAGVSFLYSMVVIFGMICTSEGRDVSHGLHELYFESAAMILTLITVGKMLEARAKGKTTDAVKALMDLSPKTARIERDGVEETVPTSEVKVGNIFILKAGDCVPVDGVVIDGECSVMEAALTGESVPLDKTVGDSIFAATFNSSGYVKCRATSVGENTKISGVVRLVEEASATKAPIAKIADKVSGIFVPAILLISLLTFGIWWLAFGSVSDAVVHSIAVLVISCPCALGLATPVAIMVGSGVGARLGILYKTAEAIELTGRADTVVLDKTGTVTEGMPEVAEVITAEGISDEKLLSVAYSLEDKSEHPQGRAIVRFCEGRIPKNEVENFENLSGNGVKGSIMQTIVYGGSQRFINRVANVDEQLEKTAARLSCEGKTPLLFAEGGVAIGIIATADKVREDSAAAVAEMKKMGLSVVMLTGDNSRVAETVGGSLGFDEIISDVLPEGKADAIERLKQNGRVIMIGDGINDAPALALADVGMAIGGGTDIAIESADVVLVKNSLSDAVKAIKLGRRVLNNIHQNLFFAFLYNCIGIPMAAGLFGFILPPMFGALAMSLSSFSVVSNALRINGFSGKNALRTHKNDKIRDLSQTDDRSVAELGGEDGELLLLVDGMMCPHCEARVSDALRGVPGIVSVTADHKNGTAVVQGNIKDESALVSAVENAGYKAAVKK